MFWFVKTVHYIHQYQKAKLDYHMSMLFEYMAGGERVRLEVLKCFVRGGQNFSTCFVCVWGGQVQYLSFREKNNRPHLLLINDWSL